MSGTVYLIPTELAPGTGSHFLGSEVKKIIAGLSLFLVENIRTSRRFISSLSLGLNISDLEFLVLDKETELMIMLDYVDRVMAGESVGVMSEAGSPGVADPGGQLVSLAHERGLSIVPLPGPSSFLLALMASGMNGQGFQFHGYLPIKGDERVRTIRELEKQSKKQNQAQIFMETPYRNNQLFDTLLKTCQPTTRLCVARDITGPKQYVRTLTMAKWKGQMPELHKLPTVFILEA